MPLLWPSLPFPQSPLQMILPFAGARPPPRLKQVPPATQAGSSVLGAKLGCPGLSEGSRSMKDLPYPPVTLHLIYYSTYHYPRRDSVPERTLIFWATIVSFPSEPEKRDSKEAKFPSATFRKGVINVVMCVTPRYRFWFQKQPLYHEAAFKITFTRSFFSLEQ